MMFIVNINLWIHTKYITFVYKENRNENINV